MKNILFHRNFHFNFFFTPPFSLLILKSIFFSEMPRKSDQKELCSSCDKLILKSNISRHQKLHAKRCLQCSQLFPDDEKLQRHIASKHTPSLTQKKKFLCRSCNSTFSTYQLLHHKRNNHQHSVTVAYDDVDLSIYGDSPALHSELQTVQHFLQDSVLKLSRKKSTISK